MATNPPKGDGHRNGAVRDRSQTYNPKTETWVKRDSDNGRFIDVKRMGHHLKVFAKKNKMELIFVNKRGYSEIRIASFFLSK